MVHGASMHVSREEWQQLSHRQRRSLVNRERKRWKRRQAALRREEEEAALASDPEYLEEVVREDKEREEQLRREKAQSLLEEASWEEKERRAQEEFRKKREKEEAVLREREERERLIREEWEALQRKEREEEEKREQERKKKEDRLQEALSVGDKPPPERWHNPLAPEDTRESVDYGTERDSVNCSFFLKTGVCRFGDRCSRAHPRPAASTTLLIRGMFQSLAFQEQVLDEQDHDVGLEYDEGEVYAEFKEFYEDVLPEFAKAGKIMQFKVSCNYEPHLRGNVYVQFSTEDECATAFGLFNGRWYAQKQLSCLFNRGKCPKGRRCNFLHVFRNPRGAFSEADWDSNLPSPPPSSRRRERREWGLRRHSRHNRSRSRSRSFSPESHHRWRESRERRRSRHSHSRERERRRRERDGRDGRERRYSRRSHSRSRSRDRGREKRSVAKGGESTEREEKRSQAELSNPVGSCEGLAEEPSKAKERNNTVSVSPDIVSEDSPERRRKHKKRHSHKHRHRHRHKRRRHSDSGSGEDLEGRSPKSDGEKRLSTGNGVGEESEGKAPPPH